MAEPKAPRGTMQGAEPAPSPSDYGTTFESCLQTRINVHQDEHSEYRQDPVPQQRALANYLYIKDEFEEAKQSK